MAENGRIADEGKKSHCVLGSQVLLGYIDVFKSNLALNGLMQNNVKIHQPVQIRFSLKRKEKEKRFHTCSKNTTRRLLQHSFQRMLHSDLHISLHSYCDHDDGRKGSSIFMPSQDLKKPFLQHTVFLKRLIAIWMDCKQAEHVILD